MPAPAPKPRPARRASSPRPPPTPLMPPAPRPYGPAPVIDAQRPLGLSAKDGVVPRPTPPGRMPGEFPGTSTPPGLVPVPDGRWTPPGRAPTPGRGPGWFQIGLTFPSADRPNCGVARSMPRIASSYRVMVWTAFFFSFFLLLPKPNALAMPPSTAPAAAPNGPPTAKPAAAAPPAVPIA